MTPRRGRRAKAVNERFEILFVSRRPTASRKRSGSSKRRRVVSRSRSPASSRNRAPMPVREYRAAARPC